MDQFFEWSKDYGEGLGSLVTAVTVVAGGVWAIWEYRRAKSRESAKWLHDLFSSFYLEHTFDKLRMGLEFEYSNKLAPLIERVLIDDNAEFSEADKQLLCDLDTTLNYLEFILHLEKSKHLGRSDRQAIFAFWYQLISKPDYAALRMYLCQFGYEGISWAVAGSYSVNQTRPQCVAFYGTLTGEHGTQEDLGLKGKLTVLGLCTINGELRDLGEYPGLVPGGEAVRGELYEVTDTAAFKILDDYEEFEPSHPEKSVFVRRAVRLKDPEIDCWAYFYNGDASLRPKVDAVDWSTYKKGRSA
jgi:gamma-glutamylcyclotransferase (GGCT)/AIG2-like uncharacterized protein YtfP